MTLFDTCGPTQTPDDIDIDALREKYSQERDKRLRPEGATQYLELKDDFAEFAEVDPHTPVTPRTPINEDVEVAVLGGGIAGLLAGAYLKKAGVDDVHVIEMGGDFGGVWYWNGFPESNATTMRTATSRCSKSSTSYLRRSSPTEPRSSSIAATSASISGSTTVPSSPRRFARCGGTRTSSAGGWPPTVATTSGLASWS